LEARARQYQQDSKLDLAIGDLTKLVGIDPKNPERYTARADVWSEIESYDQAIADLDAAVALQPNNPELYLARSRLWEKKGDDNRVSADLDQLVRLRPSAENFVKRAEYNLDKDRTAAAVADYGMAIKMDRKNVDYLKARAAALQRKGDATLAQADYLSVISLYDASITTAPTADAVRDRAEIWKQLKNYKKALADYTLAIRLDPGSGYNYDLRYFLVRDMTDSSAEVMKYLDEFVSRESTFAHNYRIRAEFRGEDEIEKALADYGQAIRLKPDEVDFRFARAALLEKKGKFVEAIEDYDKIVQIDPKNARALYRRGMAKSSKGNRTGAADISAAKALDPDVAN
jgi:tetratricopeptide (TPR) repeat protein